MNYRQWKKCYKKVHGCNPPEDRDMHLIIKTCNKMVKILSDVIRDLPNIMERAKQSFINMSDEEFKEALDRMGDNSDAKLWACLIRSMGDESNNTDL